MSRFLLAMVIGVSAVAAVAIAPTAAHACTEPYELYAEDLASIDDNGELFNSRGRIRRASDRVQ